MAWLKPASKGIDEWETRLLNNDPSLNAIHVFKARKFDHEEVERICQALKANTTLTELSSSGHAMQPETASLVAEMLTSNTALTSLCVGDRSFGDQALLRLAAGLTTNTTLQRLDLGQRSLSAEGVRALGQAVGQNSGLRYVNLSRNPLKTEGAKQLAPWLQYLEEVDLSECELDAESMVALAVAVAAPTSRLRCLHLQQNNIGEDGAEALASAVASGPSLDELYLSECRLGDTGAAAIAKALALSPKLRIVDLAQNGISCKGAEYLAEAISQKTPLRALRLRGNSIQDTGVEALSKAVACSSDLEELDLGMNQLGPRAAELVAGGKHLRKLSLFGAHLGDEGAGRVAAIMGAEALTGLLELELSGCSIGNKGMQALLNALQTGVAPALEVLLVAANPAVEKAGFDTQVEMLQALRPELDIAYTVRGGMAPELDSLSPKGMPHEQPATLA